MVNILHNVKGVIHSETPFSPNKHFSIFQHVVLISNSSLFWKYVLDPLYLPSINSDKMSYKLVNRVEHLENTKLHIFLSSWWRPNRGDRRVNIGLTWTRGAKT